MESNQEELGLRKRLEALEQARELCEEKKIELFRGVNRLKQELRDGVIDDQRFNEELAKLPKAPPQIISDCNEEIRAIEADAAIVKKQLDRLLDKKRKEKVSAAVVIALVVLLSVSALFITSRLTGFITREEVNAYSQHIGVNFTQQQQYVLDLNKTGELRSLALSGRLIGEGKAKVYLQKDSTRLLVFDAEALHDGGARGIIAVTGMAVADITGEDAVPAVLEENATPGANESEANATLQLPEQQSSLALNETQANETAVNETVVNETLPMPESLLPLPETPSAVEKSVNIALAYKSGTVFDSNDDGVELDTSAIDFTVEGTNFSWAADGQKLCTRWVTRSLDNNTQGAVCYGSADCCAIVDLSPEQPNWNDVFYAFVGKYGATYNNSVSAQVIFANYSLGPEIVYSEIYYSNFSTLPAIFITLPLLEENLTENVTVTNVTVIEFNNVCVETCSLAGVAGLNLSEYTLVVEVENATLVLDNASYTLAKAVEADAEPPVVTILFPRNITYTDTIGINESRNTMPLKLNFTVSEPAVWIGYSLNGLGNVTITANTTITAANKTNALVLYAIDEAGNIGYAVAQFFVNITTAPVIDAEPPAMAVISPQQNSTYNTTAVALNFTLSEPSSVSYFLNLQNKTEAASNVTLAAEEGRNRLLLLATDAAGNVAYESVVFFVNTSNVTAANLTANIMPTLKALKSHFKLGEDAELKFEYINKKELVRVGKWKDEYEGYEDDYREYLAKVSATRKESIEKAVKEKAEGKARKKQLENWVAPDAKENITVEVFDGYGRKIEGAAEVEELREGTFKLKVPSKRAIKPGIYTVEVELTKGNETYTSQQSFAWGLISLNTNRSIYRPGQEAQFIVVVLDQYGRGVSNANVAVAITEPGNDSVALTSLAGQIAETEDLGVYTATYIPEVEGNYSVVASTVIDGQLVAFDTYFLALDSYKYDIIRSAKSKIDPTKEPEHAVTISIEDLQPQNTAASAIVVREFVPAVFNITATDAEVTTVNDAKVISWNKELANNKATISYSYSVPKLWPRLYELGPAEISGGNSTFTEARPWYVAVDPVGKKQQKTVEYFVLQNYTQSINTGAAPNWTIVNVYIPENGALALKSAWLDVYFGMSAGVTVAGGRSGVQVNGTHAWAFGQGGATTGEYLMFNYLANLTASLSRAGFFRTGFNVYNFTINITPAATTGVVNIPSAKLYLTYEYDDISQEQLQTVRRFIGVDNSTPGGIMPASAGMPQSKNFTLPNMSNGLPNSAVIRDAWIEIYGVAGQDTATDTRVNITLDSESQGNANADQIDFGDASGSVPFRYLYKPSSFNPNLPHTLNISVSGGTNNMTGISAEMVMTYSFDTAAGNGRLETMRFLIMQDGSSFGAAGNSKVGRTTVSLPQNSVKVQDAYVVVTGTYGVATTATTDNSRAILFNVNRTGASDIAGARRSQVGLRQSTTGAANVASSFRLLYNASSLSGLANGNGVNCTVGFDGSGIASPGCELIITYNYSYSDSTTLAKTVGFFIGSSGAEAGATGPTAAAAVNLSRNFTVDYPSDEGAITILSPYIWATNPNVATSAALSIFMQNMSNSRSGNQTLVINNPDNEQFLAWGNYNVTNLINTSQTRFFIGLGSPAASTYNAWAWVTYSYGAPPLSRIVDNSFTTNDTSINEGDYINITGNYSNTGNSGSNWNLTLNYTDTTGATRFIDRTCAVGDGFQVTSMFFACNATAATKGSCFESRDTGSAIMNMTSSAKFFNVTWILRACTGAGTNSPYTIATNATNVSTAAGSLLGLNASAFTKSVTITVNVLDTTPPNNSIIVPLQNMNFSGSFVINASINDSASNVLQVNLTVYNNTGNATRTLPMNISTGNFMSGYWNITFDSTTLRDARYNLSVNATDSSAAQNTNISLNVSITIDNTKANVSGISPANGTSFSEQNILINASVNDSLTKVSSVAFRFIDSATTYDWVSASLNSGSIDQGYWNATVDSGTISNGDYNITINATDYAGNQQLINISQIIVNNPLVAVSQCQNLDATNGAYRLASNVNAFSTCFNITATNVTLDCNGLTVEYANASRGYGINITGVNNATVKNCFFTQKNASVQFNTAAIFALNSNNSIFINNTINSSGNYSYGIVAVRSNSTNISNNRINVSGNFSHGIGLGLSGFNNITTNNITTQGGNNGYGINLTGSSTNLVFGNTISTRGISYSTGNYGILLILSANNNTVANNTISTNGGGGGGSNVGINLANTISGSIVSGNIISTNGTINNYGILLNSVVSNSVVSGNIISTNGSSAYHGIYLVSSSVGNVVSGNEINATGAGSANGINLQNNNDNNTISNNTIYVTGGPNNRGISLTTSSDNVVSGNFINITGTNTNPGIVLQTNANNNTISSNIINTGGSQDSNYGIFLNSIINNVNITKNRISTSGTSNNFGIYLTPTVVNVNISENNISTSGTTNSYGIRLLTKVNRTYISGNIITPTGSSGAHGIYVVSAPNNTIVFNTINVTGASAHGIFLDTPTVGSGNETITDNNITTTGSGSRTLYIKTNSSIIARNRIFNNDTTGIGIYFENQLTDIPNFNLVYDNTINVSATPVSGASQTMMNYMNTTNSSGTNIMGGNMIGGNFYDNITGTGRSENCTDATHDGFCDEFFNWSGTVGEVVDYLPLSNWSAPTPVSDNNGTLNVTLYNGNISISQNSTFSINASVLCQNGNCHQINSTAFYNITGTISSRLNDTALNKPFFNVTGFQNQTCGFLSQDGNCSINWTINATGPINSSWLFTINFTSNNSEIQQNGTGNFQVNITTQVVSNNVPVVFNDSVALNSSVTLTDGGDTEFTVRFNVTDADGVGNLNNAAAGVNITYNGIKRSNNSGNCENQDNGANTRLYTCKVVFRYFDNSSSIWDINITAADSLGAVGYNDSSNYGAAGGGGAAHNLTINSLSAFSIVSSSIASTTSMNTQNVEMTFVINNTGNFDFTLINLTPTDLNASLTDIFKLEYNFSINATASTGIGFGVNLTNGTPTNFSDSLLGGQLSATLPHKTSLISGQGSTEGDTKANRTLYIYIDIPQNKGLSTGVTYNASPSYPWQVILGTPS